jgi:hypothetical protein
MLDVMSAVSACFTTDRNGLAVATRTRVRVLGVSSSVLDRLETPERERVLSMVGEIFEVYEVDEWGGAWVEKWWHESDDQASSHSLGLHPSEMEVSSSDV